MLAAEGLTRRYGSHPAVADVSLDVTEGERLGLHGPSGCGKSTLLRLLALVEAPDAGRVLHDGRPVVGWGARVAAPTRQRVQLLWQSPRQAADPRRRVGQLIGEAVALAGHHPVIGEQVGDRVATLADQVGLTADLLARWPHEVSDGQLQRACLARALAVGPDVLLCDELGSMLDVSTQASLLDTIAAQQRATGMAVVLVSHDRILLDHWCTRTLGMAAGSLR